MKNNISFSSLIFLAIVATTFTACKKDDVVSPSSNTDILLVKTTNWNPATGAESGGQEYIYDDAGKLKSIKYSNSSLTATYANGKLVGLAGKNAVGSDTKYTIEYNATGQLSKVSFEDNASLSNAYTNTFTYNAGGKISQTSRQQTNTVVGSNPQPASISNYTWNGDNIATSSYTSNGSLYTTEYTVYDDKVNPESKGERIVTIIYGSPVSKNNITEIKSTSPTYNVVQKRGYTYSSAGYPMSMKLLDGSNEGSKYYYNK